MTAGRSFTACRRVRNRFFAVFRVTRNVRLRSFSPPLCVNPGTSNVSGFPSPRNGRSRAANRPNSIRRVVSGSNAGPNFSSRSFRVGQERLGLVPVREPENEIVRITHDDPVTPGVPAPPLSHP
jgi:hypothetical protein